MTLILLAVLAQDPEALVERLRSGSPAEREEAVKALKDLGEAAGPALRKAAGDADVDVSAPAKRLLDRLAIDRSLTPRMKKTFPGLADRLATSELAWAETFSAAAGMTRQPGGLKNADLAPLASRALLAPSAERTVWDLVQIVRTRGLREGIPGLTALLRHPEAGVVDAAVEALKDLEAKEAFPELYRMLSSPTASDRLAALRVFRELKADEAAPAVRRLLRDPLAEVRLKALLTLKAVPVRAAEAPDVAALLTDPDVRVRGQAAETLGGMRAVREAGKLKLALKDGDEKVRWEVVDALLPWGPDVGGDEVLAAVLGMAPPERQEALEGLAEQRWPGILAVLVSEARGSPDESLRATATYELRNFPAAAPMLLEIASHGKGEPRRRALLAFKKQQLPGALPLLVAELSSPSAELRRAAEAVLGFWKDEEAAAGVRPLLDHRSSEVRWAAVGVLSARGDASVRERIRTGLENPDASVRQVALEAARLLGDPALADAVTRRLADPVRDCARLAEHVLSKRIFRESEAVLLELLGHPDGSVRRSALQRLWKTRSRAAFVPARRLLADPASQVRAEAAGLLGAFGVKEALPELRALLKDPDLDVVVDAMRALVDLGAKDAAGEIAGFRTSENVLVRRGLLEALEGLRAREHAPLVRAMLRDEAEGVRAVAARAAGEWGLGDAEADLADLVEDEASEVRWEALGALAALGARSRIPEVAGRLADRVREIAWKAALVLGEFGAKEHLAAVVELFGRDGLYDEGQAARLVRQLLPPEGPGLLRTMLEAPDAEVRYGAAAALGLLGSAEAVPALIRAAKDPLGWVRVAALQALGRIGGAEGRGTLLEALDDPDGNVVYMALSLLDDQGAATAEGKLRDLLRDPWCRGEALRAASRGGAAWTRETACALLEDDGSRTWDPEYAVRALARVGGPESVRVLREWRIPAFRTETRLERAKGLCRLGLADEADRVIRHGEDLYVLNAVLAPDAWADLKRFRWEGEGFMTRHEVAERIAARLGWRLEAAERAKDGRPTLVRPGTPLLDVLETAQPQWVLDGGTLRLLTVAGAEDFWERWAAERKKK